MSSHSVPSVLITRPIGQQQDFALRCTKLGFDVSLLPCLLIVAIPVSQQSLLTLLSTHEAVLFTSTNAVRCAHATLPLPWPDTVVHAIGAATASSLQNHGQAVHLQPQTPFNSEAYLSQLEQQTPCASLACELGFSAETLVAMPPGDAGQLECLDQWKNIHHKPAN